MGFKVEKILEVLENNNCKDKVLTIGIYKDGKYVKYIPTNISWGGNDCCIQFIDNERSYYHYLDTEYVKSGEFIKDEANNIKELSEKEVESKENFVEL